MLILGARKRRSPNNTTILNVHVLHAGGRRLPTYMLYTCVDTMNPPDPSFTVQNELQNPCVLTAHVAGVVLGLQVVRGLPRGS